MHSTRRRILVGALDAIDAGALEEIVLGLVQDDDGFVEAAREVREGRAAAIHAAVVVGEKQIRVGVVADDPVVEPAFDDALGRALEEVLRRAPRHRVRDVIGGREARLLRLEDHIPFLLRPEIEDLRRAVVAGEVGIFVEVEGLGLGSLVPAGEIEIGHAPAIAPCGGGEDVPAAVVENDGGVLHRDDGVARIGGGIDERTGGDPALRERVGGARSLPPDVTARMPTQARASLRRNWKLLFIGFGTGTYSLLRKSEAGRPARLKRLPEATLAQP